MSQPTILIVEDDAILCEALCDTLSLSGYDVLAAGDGQHALELLDKNSVQMVVSDVQMQPMDGQELLKRIKAKQPNLPIVLATAYGTIQSAVAAMQLGASDYIVKPFEVDTLVSMVEQFLVPAPSESEMIAVDKHSRDLARLAKRVAATEATVMVMGESGTGKEVIAKLIHKHSKRVEKPFVAINCAAIPENMLEAVLFGHEKGAFTGAHQATPGKFEQAQGGTLLLDEITEMDLSLQAKLLRVLQERELERLGGRKTIKLDVRVLATTNRNLREHVAQGKFREDLYYRLNVFPITLRPLRERSDDIIPLARRLMDRRRQTDQPLPELTLGAQQRLLAHNWPGNVRELDNVIQRALILMHGNEITEETIHYETDVDSLIIPSQSVSNNGEGKLGDDLKLREQRLIIEAIEGCKGSRKSAAEKLGISPRTLRYKLQKLREQGVYIPC